MVDRPTLPELANGEPGEELPQLIARHLDWAFSLCRRSVRDAELAEDVTQDVFLILIKKAARLPHGANMPGWIFNTVRYCCNNALRNQRTRRRHELAAAHIRSEPAATEAPVRDEELIPLLDEQLARLGQADRIALLLRYYERRSLREVGDILGISEEAAKKRVQRAVEKLRSRLAGKQIPLGEEALTAILADKLVQPAPAKLTAAILAHAAHGTTATVMTASQSKISTHVSLKALASGKTALAATGAVLATALVAAGITVALAKHSHSKAPEKLIISRATTYITSPLDKDGLPDYKLALQQYLMKGVTPENNAAVPAIEIAMQGFRPFGGGKVDFQQLGAYQLKALGASAPAGKFPQPHSETWFFKKHAPQGHVFPSRKSLDMIGAPPYLVAQCVEEGYARDFSWRMSQCFLLWAAIDRNKAAAAVMRRASRLPRFYIPELVDPNRFKPPIFYADPIWAAESAGKTLMLRATLDLGRGHPKKCWRNATAIYRLSSLVRQQSDTFGASASQYLMSESLCVDRVLLGSLAGHPHLRARAWRLVRAIPILTPLTVRNLHVRRLTALAAIMRIYKKASGHRYPSYTVPSDSKSFEPWELAKRPPASVNWNWQFQHLNATFDHLDALAQAPAYSTRGGELRAWLNARSSASTEVSMRLGYLPRGITPSGYIPHEIERLFSTKISANARYHNALILTFGPDVGRAANAYHLPRMVMLIKIGYALAMFRHHHGRYPASLAELAPEYFRDPPLDPKTGKPMFYRVKGKGYELAMNKRIIQWHLIPNVPYTPQRIIMPPPAPTGWQKGPFP